MSPASTPCTPPTSPAPLPPAASSPRGSARSTTSCSARSRAAIDSFNAGLSTLTGKGQNSLYKVAYDYINHHGKDLHGQPLGQYFIHGVGHFVGLEVHDAGDIKTRLDRGMVFTIEPGIYIPEEKIGVRIEDIFYVDPNGKLVNLSGALPHTADEVEAAMAGKYASAK